MLTLSQRERDRLAVLREVDDGLISAKHGADKLRLSARQFRRLRRAWEVRGDAALVHGVGSEKSIAVGERLTEGPRDNHGGAAGKIMRAGERARGGSGTRM